MGGAMATPDGNLKWRPCLPSLNGMAHHTLAATYHAAIMLTHHAAIMLTHHADRGTARVVQCAC